MSRDEDQVRKEGLFSVSRRSFLKMVGLAAGTALMPLKSLIRGKDTGEIIEKAAAQSDSQGSENYSIFGNKVTGIVENGEHRFKLGGNINKIYLEEGATVKVNGEEVTEQELEQITEGQCLIGEK